MALAIDASTPALASANSGDTTTTGSFTPPAGSVLCAIAWHDTATNNTTNTSAVTDSQGLAWTIRATRNKADSGGQNGHVQVSTAVVASSTSMTVTTTALLTGGSHAAGLYVLVMTGCDTGTPIDVIAEGSNASGAVSLALPATVTDLAWGFLANGDWNVAAAPTAGAGQTAIVSGNIGTGPDNRIYLGRQNAMTTPAGTVITMSTTSPTSGNTNNYIGWAFRPAAGGTTHNATVAAQTTAALTSTGVTTAITTAGPSTSTALTSTGVVTAVAAPASTTTATLASGGAVTRPAINAAATTAALTATGQRTAVATAALSTTAELAASAAGGGDGTSAAATTVSLASTGVVTAPAATVPATAAALIATASVQALAVATFGTTAGLAAAATVSGQTAKATSSAAVTAGSTSAALVAAGRTSTSTITARATSSGGVS